VENFGSTFPLVGVPEGPARTGKAPTDKMMSAATVVLEMENFVFIIVER
jgi:hypothetical protein